MSEREIEALAAAGVVMLGRAADAKVEPAAKKKSV
jgi:hypothetical protein